FAKSVSSRRLKSHSCPTVGSLGPTDCTGVSRALADRTFSLETGHARNFHRNSRGGSDPATFSPLKRLVVGVGVKSEWLRGNSPPREEGWPRSGRGGRSHPHFTYKRPPRSAALRWAAPKFY